MGAHGGGGEGRGMESHEEDCRIQRRGVGGCDQEVGNEGGEQWLDFRSLLKAAFLNGIDAGFERKIPGETDSGPWPEHDYWV